MDSRNLRIAISDENAFFRKTLRSFLEDQDNVNVVMEASGEHDLLEKLEHMPVDILITDMFTDEVNSIDLLQIIRKNHLAVKVIVLSLCRDLDLIGELLNVGVYAYISKSDEPDELLKAIQSASISRVFRSPLFTEALYNVVQKRLDVDFTDNPVLLSPREKTVIELLWQEYNNKEIGDRLFLSERSIEKIRRNLKAKLKAESTIDLLKYAISRRIITAKPTSRSLKPHI